jgi:branched-subunit amino acid ABC-type transport system permease component
VRGRRAIAAIASAKLLLVVRSLTTGSSALVQALVQAECGGVVSVAFAALGTVLSAIANVNVEGSTPFTRFHKGRESKDLRLFLLLISVCVVGFAFVDKTLELASLTQRGYHYFDGLIRTAR